MTTPPIATDAERLASSTPLFLVARDEGVPAGAEEAARLQGFEGELDQLCFWSGGILVGTGDGSQPLAVGSASMRLPSGDYRFEGDGPQRMAVLGFALGAYRFTKYRGGDDAPVLIVEDQDLAQSVNREAGAIALGRDLINTPTEDMGPDALEAVTTELAKAHGATLRVHKGEGFADAFPLVHAVGRASHKEPRVMEFEWAGGGAHRLTLVGKGVCFDTGGLNLKGGKSMALMKKDMGGAATTLALARRIMEERLPLHLHVIIPAVENAVAGNSFRPGDVFSSRDGQTVEISNTDAEGRLILADALTLAAENKPDRIMTLATLTGAARVALGPDLPPIYATDADFQRRICEAGMAVGDPLWPMPFWERYESYLKSDIADVNHAADTPFAGSITAALFLKRFVPEHHYTHIDTFAWNPQNLPGRPKGGETLALRAIFAALQDEFSRTTA